MRWALLLLIATGCRQLLGFERPIENTPGDATGDALPPGTVCAGSPDGLAGRQCFQPTGAVMIGGVFEQIDTDTDERCDAGVPGVCRIVGSEIEIHTFVTAAGGRPLVLASAGSIEISALGSLDVSGGASLKNGAGANDSTCLVANGLPRTDTTPNIGGGGGGGSFARPGGAGGEGQATQGMTGSIQAGPTAAPALRGGCPGGAGGLELTGGGASGGAVYLIAADSIVIRGSIGASGAGGAGGSSLANGELAGGGGGGSGGLIGLDAPLIDLDSATLLALGGGGGSGAGGMVDGKDGGAPPAAAGGEATVPNNQGGAGGSLAGGPGAAGGNVGANQAGGGGGGGGGPGYIFMTAVPVMMTGSMIAPPPTMP